MNRNLAKLKTNKFEWHGYCTFLVIMIVWGILGIALYYATYASSTIFRLDLWRDLSSNYITWSIDKPSTSAGTIAFVPYVSAHAIYICYVWVFAFAIVFGLISILASSFFHKRSSHILLSIAFDLLVLTILIVQISFTVQGLAGVEYSSTGVLVDGIKSDTGNTSIVFYSISILLDLALIYCHVRKMYDGDAPKATLWLCVVLAFIIFIQSYQNISLLDIFATPKTDSLAEYFLVRFPVLFSVAPTLISLGSDYNPLQDPSINKAALASL